jgi:hypothetical protein
MVTIKLILLCAKMAGDRNCTYVSESLPHSRPTEKCARIKHWLYVTEDGRMDKHFLHIGKNNSNSGHRYCPTYTTVTVPKIRRKSNFAHVGIKHTIVQLYMNIAGSPAAVQTATVWKLFGRSKTAPRPVLFFCHFLNFALSLPQEKIRHVLKMLLISFLIFFLKLLNLKLPKFWKVCSRKKRYGSNMTDLWYMNQCSQKNQTAEEIFYINLKGIRMVV